MNPLMLLGNPLMLSVSRQGKKMIPDPSTGEMIESGVDNPGGEVTEVFGYMHELTPMELTELSLDMRNTAKFKLYCATDQPRLHVANVEISVRGDEISFTRDDVTYVLELLDETHWVGTHLDHSSYILGLPESQSRAS